MSTPTLVFFYWFLLVFGEGLGAEPEVPIVEGVSGERIRIGVEESVLLLNEENFDFIVVSKPIVLILFHTTWCHHCRHLLPEFETAAKSLTKDSEIVLAKVDAQREESLALRQHVTSFPTLLLFRNGSKSEEYFGERTHLAIEDWIRLQLDPHFLPPDLVSDWTEDEWTRAKKQKKSFVFLIHFFAHNCSKSLHLNEEFSRAARRLQNVRFARVNASHEHELTHALSISDNLPVIFILRAGKAVELKNTRKEWEIVERMSVELTPPSKETPNGMKDTFGGLLPTIIAFLRKNSEEMEIFFSVSRELREKGFSGKLFHIFWEKGDKKGENNYLLIRASLWFRSKYESSEYRLSINATQSVESIVGFVLSHARPLVGWRRRENLWLFDTSFPLVVVYVDSLDFSHESLAHSQVIRARVLEVAKKYEKIVFCLSREDEFTDEIKELSLEDTGEEVNVGIWMSSRVHYTWTPEHAFDSHGLEEFVRHVLNRQIEELMIAKEGVSLVKEGVVKKMEIKEEF